MTGTTGSGVPVNIFINTNPDGSYNFTNLAPGTYKVTFGQPSGYLVTPADQGGNDALDSDANPSTLMGQW
ncbi:MAG: SdrD B-like domain-containing protein [Saprospiraceae bacterium]